MNLQAVFLVCLASCLGRLQPTAENLFDLEELHCSPCFVWCCLS